MKEQNTNLPDYLKDLAEPTTIGRAKLLAIWDELNLDNQIELLASIKDDYKTPYFEVIHRIKNGEPSPGKIPSQEDLNQELLLKALGSDNEYIRHLAASQLYTHGTLTPKSYWTKINTLIDNDKSDLVKYTKYLAHWSFPEDFFKLPLQARLIIASSKRTVNFFKLAEVIEKAIKKGLFKSEVKETELNQVLWELVNNPKKWKEKTLEVNVLHTIESYEDVNPSLIEGKNELWKLIPDLPSSSGSILVEKLPVDSDGCLPDGLFSKLTRIQQNMLFEREDFEMVDIRKEFYFKDKNEEGEMHWHTAPKYHLSFSDEEFLEILQKPKEERNERLQCLSASRDMYLHHLLMVSYIVRYDNEEAWRYNWGKEFLDKALKDYYKILEEDEWILKEFEGESLYKFRLVSLAFSSERWADEADAPIPSLFSRRVKDDIWSTYLNFYDELRYNELDYKDLPISYREHKEEIPISLRNPEPAEVPYESSYDVLNEKIDLSRIQILNKIKERAILIIIVLAVFIMFWDR